MATESFRNEHLYRLPDELGPRVTKNSLGLRIDHDNLAISVDHHDSVWRSVDDYSEAPLVDGSLEE